MNQMARQLHVSVSRVVTATAGECAMKTLVSDALRERVQQLLPPPPPRRFRFPGRKPLDYRKVLTGILFVLKTGIAWDDLPVRVNMLAETRKSTDPLNRAERDPLFRACTPHQIRWLQLPRRCKMAQVSECDRPHC